METAWRPRRPSSSASDKGGFVMSRWVRRVSTPSCAIAVAVLGIVLVSRTASQAEIIHFGGTITTFNPPSTANFTIDLNPGGSATYNIGSGAQSLDRGVVNAQQNGSNVTGVLISTMNVMKSCVFTAIVAGSTINATLDQDREGV